MHPMEFLNTDRSPADRIDAGCKLRPDVYPRTKMDERARRARDIQRHIGEILLREWDPIGIQEHPEAADEYDAYVGGVYRLLASVASAREIATHLVAIETESLGWEDTDPRMLIPLARKLLRLNVRLSPDVSHERQSNPRP